MKFNLSLAPLKSNKGMSWKEREQPAIILDLESSKKVTAIQTIFHKSLWKTLPEAVYYHTRKGNYQVFGLTNYDHCSGIMTFYGKGWNSRPEEISKTIPHGTGVRSFCYMPNEKAVCILNNGYLYKVDRYKAKVKTTIRCLTASAVFVGQTIYTVDGRFIKEYSFNGSYLTKLSPSLTWARSINSGAFDYITSALFVGNDKGQFAVVDKETGAILSEGIFNDGGSTGFKIIGFNGEALLVSCEQTKKIYWLDLNFNEITSIDYSIAIPDSSLLSYDGRDILALSKNGTLSTFNIQDNWEYAGVTYTASKKNTGNLPPITMDVNNIFILYCEYPWDQQKIKSVIGYLDPNRKATDIMFDGLLIMAQTHNNKSLMGGQPTAGLPEWNWYLEKLMNQDGLYGSVNLAAGAVRQEANLPGFKPKVIIGIPYPMDNLDRYQWFIEQCITGSTQYQNVVLAGFYYTEEFKPDPICNAIKTWLHAKGLKYIWSPGYPVTKSIKRNRTLFDAIFYQTGYPWGYFRSKKGKEYELTLAMNNITKYALYPNIESMNDTRWFTFIRDKTYALWDIMLNYGVDRTTKLHFAGNGLVPESCFSKNPFERQFYDLYHEFLRGRRISGMANSIENKDRNYHFTQPHSIPTDKIKIMPGFTRNPPARRIRTLELKKIKIFTQD